MISQPVVINMSLDESKTTLKAEQAAVTLYFADEGEQIWDIAKRYHTSVGAILEENDLDAEIMTQGGMILIPLID